MKKNVIVVSKFIDTEASVKDVELCEKCIESFLTPIVKTKGVLIFFHTNINNADLFDYIKEFPITVVYVKEEEHYALKKQSALSLKSIKTIKNETELKKELTEYTTNPYD